MATPFRIKRSAVPGKGPSVSDLQLGELALNTYDAELYTLRSRPGIGTEVVKIGGAAIENVLYVNKDGDDGNSGSTPADAKATLKAAVGIASEGTAIKIAAGTYIENNPIKVPKQVSIVGDSLREVTVSPQNADEDMFHVSPGDMISELTFSGTVDKGIAVIAFDPDKIQYVNQSPYIRFCTNRVANSIGLKVDGNKAVGPFKSMVTDSYTQYNVSGIGVSVSNEGYAQIVSLFTMNLDEAVACHSGGQCDVTNSNSSFGNYGLVADGVGALQYTGTIASESKENTDKFEVNLAASSVNISNFVYDHVSGLSTVTTSSSHGFQVGMGVTLADVNLSCAYGNKIYPHQAPYVFTVASVPNTTTFTTNIGISTVAHTYVSGGNAKINLIRPFDGKAVYFDNEYNTIGKIKLTNAGSGYNTAPTITIGDPSTSSTFGVTATAVATIIGSKVDEIQILSNGRGYTSLPSVTISAPDVGINTATASIELIPTYYTVKESTPISSGICTITINETLPYSVGVGVTVPFFRQSRVLASSHSFQYIGSGVDPIDSLPSRGGVTIQENEVDNRNGGLVVYTSTDQGGNFRIGDGVQIDQISGTITGNSYSKSLFANVTPLILALGGDS